jgi:hypothetical protein
MQISNVSTIDIYFKILMLCQWLTSQEGFTINGIIIIVVVMVKNQTNIINQIYLFIYLEI